MTGDLDAMFGFYSDVVGLSAVVGDAGSSYAVLRGSYGTGDVTLLRRRPSLEPSLHHVGVEVDSEANLDRALRLLPEHGIRVERHVDHPARRAITIPDSSGIRLQFYVNRNWQPQVIGTASEDEAPYLL